MKTIENKEEIIRGVRSRSRKPSASGARFRRSCFESVPPTGSSHGILDLVAVLFFSFVDAFVDDVHSFYSGFLPDNDCDY
jgi:hypothetical protein